MPLAEALLQCRSSGLTLGCLKPASSFKLSRSVIVCVNQLRLLSWDGNHHVTSDVDLGPVTTLTAEGNAVKCFGNCVASVLEHVRKDIVDARSV